MPFGNVKKIRKEGTLVFLNKFFPQLTPAFFSFTIPYIPGLPNEEQLLKLFNLLRKTPTSNVT
jgi:hypothetical protein